MEKINIGFMISYLGLYGPANVMFNIIKYLPKDKFNVFLFVIDRKNKKEDNLRFQELGIQIIELKSSKYEVFFYNTKRLQKIINKNNIKIMHSHCLPSCILISKVKNCKKIATIHCNVREDFKLSKNIILAKIMEKLYFKSLEKMDLRICCSESIEKEISKYSKLKMCFIRNGIDLRNFFIDVDKIKLKEKLKLDKNYKYLIGVGRFSERKGILFIAEQFNKLYLRDFKLILLGSGYEDHSIENKIKELNNKNIITPGRVSNVNEYLNASDYFISASLYEGLPNSVLEACAAKLPLLLSNIGPHKEILNIENAGFLYELKNEKDFKEKLMKLINSNYKEYSENSLKIVIEVLNAEKMAKEYERQYQQLLKDKK